MSRNVWKPIIAGILLGAGFYFIPFFILKVLLLFLIIGGIFRLFWWRRPYHYAYMHVANADKIRNMTEEEFAEYKSKMHQWQHHCCYHDSNNCERQKSK